MAITIELRPEVEAELVRVAASEGMGIEPFIERLIEDRFPSPPQERTPEELYEHLLGLAREFHKLPTYDHRAADEIVGYDEYGFPRR